MQKPDQLRDKGRKSRRGARIQHRRDEPVLEHDPLVGAALYQVSDRYPSKAVRRIALGHNARAQCGYF